MRKILIVDDDENLAWAVRKKFEALGFEVLTAADGRAGAEMVEKEEPSLVILDLNLPDVDGLDICRYLRRRSNVPIVMLTGRAEDNDAVVGLELGADDYITKPFSPRVLIARIRSVLRRRDQPAVADDATTSHLGVRVTPGRHDVRVDGASVSVTATELRLLHLLIRRPGWVHTRDQIIAALHGEDYSATDRSIDVQVVGLRKKLGAAGELIETVRGVGYRFRE